MSKKIFVVVLSFLMFVLPVMPSLADVEERIVRIEYLDHSEPETYFTNFQPYMDRHGEGKVQFLTSVEQALPLAKPGEGFKSVSSSLAKDDYPFKREIFDEELKRNRSCGSRTGYRTDQDLILWRLFQNNIFDPDLSANLELGGEVDTGKKGWDFMKVAVNGYDVNRIPAKKAVAWEGNQADSRLFWVADVTNKGKTVVLETFIDKKYTVVEAPAKNFYYIHIASVKKPFNLTLPGCKINPRFGSVGGALVRGFIFYDEENIMGFQRPVKIIDLRTIYSESAYLSEFPPLDPEGENAKAFLVGVDNDKEATMRDFLIMIEAYWKKTGFIKVLGQPATFDRYAGPKVVDYADKEQVIHDPQIGTVAKGLEMYGLLDYLFTVNSNGNKALIPDRTITRGQIAKFLRVFIGRNGYETDRFIFGDEEFGEYPKNRGKLDTAQIVTDTLGQKGDAQDLYRDIFNNYRELSQFKMEYRRIYAFYDEEPKPIVEVIYY